MSKDIRLSGKRPLRGRIRLPGDKSISHRAAMMLALSDGEAKISNYASGDDCESTLSCLKQLGVSISKSDLSIKIRGVGKQGLKPPEKVLDCGNSGTTMRLLAGILAGHPFETVFTGDDSLRSRPMRRIADPLRLMGADVTLTEHCAPMKIKGRLRLEPFEYELPVASAQVKTCLLLAGLNAKGPLSVTGPASASAASISRDHTERMLRFLGVDLVDAYPRDGDGYRQITSLNPPEKLSARDIDVPGDISTAAFFLVAAAGLKGSDITLSGVGLNKSRATVVDVMKECGVRISISNESMRNNEPRGDVRVSWDGDCELKEDTLQIAGEKAAALIDEIPVLAVLGTLLPGGIEIRDASELRVKESDRITAVVENLNKMGASVKEFADGFRVSKSSLYCAEMASYGDHRIAMAFAVASMFADGESIIKGAECVSVSYPAFFESLRRLSG